MNPFLFYAKMQFISALEQRYKTEKRMKSELKGSIDYFKQKRGLTQITQIKHTICVNLR